MHVKKSVLRNNDIVKAGERKRGKKGEGEKERGIKSTVSIGKVLSEINEIRKCNSALRVQEDNTSD